MGYQDWARRELKKDEAQRYAREVGALTKAQRATAADGATALKTQRVSCKASVDKVRADADAAFKRDVAKAGEKRAAAVQPAKDQCAAAAQQLRQETFAAIDRLKKRVEELRTERDLLARAERAGRQRVKTSAKERRSESDDEVLANIDPELHSLFHRVKKTIKGSDRRSRTEDFLHYVEEHPDEALQARADAADAWLRRELKGLSKTSGSRPARRRASGEKVPF